MKRKPTINLFPGFTEREGREARLVLFLSNKLFELFQLFGYEPIELPIIEDKRLFSKKYLGTSPWPGWHERSLFGLKITNYEKDYNKIRNVTKAVLAPEGTMSVCRWIANQITKKKIDPKESFPLKLFYRVKCFRNEPLNVLSALKKREFEQIGAEYFGSSSIFADAEIVYLMVKGLERIGIKKKKIRVRIGDVRIFKQLIREHNIKKDDELYIKTTIDNIATLKSRKREKELRELKLKLKKYLKKIGLKNSNLRTWEKLSSLPYLEIKEALVIIKKEWPNYQVINDLKRLSEILKFCKLPFKIDFSLIRSQEYYTSLVFEIDILGKNGIYPEIAGGGRYDGLILNFFPNQKISIPATGFAYGLERILEVLKNELEARDLRNLKTTIKYFLDNKSLDYLIFPKNDIKKAWKMAEKIRENWKRAELYFEENKRKAKQYAKRRGAIFLEV
jgi:histidyl-tRNA synthetase